MSGPLGSSQFMYSSGAGNFYSHQIEQSLRFSATIVEHQVDYTEPMEQSVVRLHLHFLCGLKELKLM